MYIPVAVNKSIAVIIIVVSVIGSWPAAKAWQVSNRVHNVVKFCVESYGAFKAAVFSRRLF